MENSSLNSDADLLAATAAQHLARRAGLQNSGRGEIGVNSRDDSNNKGRGCVAETGPGYYIFDTMPAAGEQYARHNNLSPRIALMRMPHNTHPSVKRERKRERERWGFAAPYQFCNAKTFA